MQNCNLNHITYLIINNINILNIQKWKSIVLKRKKMSIVISGIESLMSQVNYINTMIKIQIKRQKYNF